MSRTDSLGQVALRAPSPTYLLKPSLKSPKKSTKVFLSYPPDWVVALSPLAQEMQAKAERWLRDRGIIQDEAGAEKFRKLAVAEYANWPFPSAKPEQAEVITKFLSLWIFYDDRIEEADDGQRDKIYAAIAGLPESAPEGDAHLRCWWELGRSYARQMSPAWLKRHALRFADWVASVREEGEAAQAFRASGIYPNAAKHLERRSRNIGMSPNIDFLEYQMGWELPEALLADPDLRQLEYLSAEVVAIINDIFGFEKDRRLHWSNLVSCLEQEFHIPLAESFRWVADMHQARIRAIGLLEQTLLSRYRDLPQLKDWLQGLRHIMYGFARWHAMAPRYTARPEVGEGESVEIQIERDSPVSGFATANFPDF